MKKHLAAYLFQILVSHKYFITLMGPSQYAGEQNNNIITIIRRNTSKQFSINSTLPQ